MTIRFVSGMCLELHRCGKETGKQGRKVKETGMRTVFATGKKTVKETSTRIVFATRTETLAPSVLTTIRPSGGWTDYFGTSHKAR